MTERPHGPSSTAQPGGHERNERPPDPPRELVDERDVCRRFTSESVAWLARVSGRGAAGTGAYGLGMIEAIHFYHASEPATPRFEALLPAGRLAGLFEEELIALLRDARAIPPPGDAPARAEVRRSRRRSD
jgi:hypothetical protein